MCGSMADNQSVTAEIRQGKKERRKETTGQKYNGLLYSTGDHNNRKELNLSQVNCNTQKS